MKLSSSGHMMLLLVFPIVLAVLAISVVGGLIFFKQQGGGVSQVMPVPGFLDVEEKLLCGQAFTFAVNPKSGECKQFGNTCIDEGWLRVEVCGKDAASWGWVEYSPSSGVFIMVIPQGWGHFVRQTSIGVLGSTYLITQVAFDDEKEGVRNPFGELLGRVELSWLGNGGFAEKSLDEFASSYYKNADPKLEPMNLGSLSVYKVVHKNCSENSGCVDFVFKEGTMFYILRSLKGETRQQDVESMMTMLESWKFRN